MEEHLSKQERRELKRAMREAKHAAAGRHNLATSMLWWGAFFLVIGGLIAYVIWDIFKPLAGTKYEILERSHVQPGAPIAYNSDPPTSGPHYAETEEWGISDKPLVIEKLVHNLEHGGIVIYYKCPSAETGCEEFVKNLKDLVQRLAKSDRKITLSPNEKLDAKIVLAAWGWMDKLNEFDEKRITKFFDDHINRGPERVL